MLNSIPNAARCPRCGLPGPHSDALECIDALRDRMATLEFQIDGRRARRAAGVDSVKPAAHVPGGRTSQ